MKTIKNKYYSSDLLKESFAEQQLTSTTSDRPLVTFALFAYNQEKYIRAAIEGALSQTYEPLEIIISDDCSTDRTFAIAEELTLAYKGKHTIILNKNKENLGLIEHVNMIFAMSRGEIIVTAAGDDVSFPQRTSEIVVEFFKNKNALAVHSNAEAIDSNGIEVGLVIPPVIEYNLDLIKIATSNSVLIGATGAYKKKIYKLYGEISESNVYEDLILGFRAALVDGLIHINRPLVKYRQGVGISTRNNNFNILEKYKNHKTVIRRNISVLKQRLEDCAAYDFASRKEISEAIENELKCNTLRLSFYENPLLLLMAIFKTAERNNARSAIRSEVNSISKLINQLLRKIITN